MKTFIQIREDLANLTEASGDTEHGFGYEKPSNDAAKKGLKAIHSTAGMKINHGHDETGNTPGSKPHKNPDATVHYERGDTPHRDGASGVTLHSAKAKAHLAAKHFQSAEKHADKEDSEGEVSESTIQESVRALPKGYVNHNTLKTNKAEYGDAYDLGHGAHEIEHPEEPSGSGRASMKTPSHPHAYAHHDKKTGKVTAVEIKHKKTSAAAVAKAMGHKEVTKAHHAIADTHNNENLV